MPLYDFACPKCGVIEEDVLVSANPIVVTHYPVCWCEPDAPRFMKRLPAAPAEPQFRGQGFHSTDYDKNGPRSTK